MRRNAASAAVSGDNGSFPVIPTEAERSEAKWRDPIMIFDKEEVPPLRFAPVGMTELDRTEQCCGVCLPTFVEKGSA